LIAIIRSHSSTSAPTDWAEEHQSGVVDDDVQASGALGDLLDGRLGLIADADVRDDDDGGAARLLDLGGEGVQAVAAPRDDGDGGAERGESAGGGGADPAARAGDERGGPGQ
jgi:hypothetical protein